MTDWLDDAACRNIDPNVFFPVSKNLGRYASFGADPYGEARRFCAECPVRGECLDAAQAKP